MFDKLKGAPISERIGVVLAFVVGLPIMLAIMVVGLGLCGYLAWGVLLWLKQIFTEVDYSKVFTDTYRTFGAWALVAGGYFIAKKFVLANVEERPSTLWEELRVYTYAFITILVITLGSHARYGTHTENDDPLRGGGDVVVDYEPTERERNEHALETFIEIGVPVMFGVYKAMSIRKRGADE